MGAVSDWLVEQGGRVVLSEITEFLGTEAILAERCANDEVREEVVGGVKHTVQPGQSMWIIARAYNTSGAKIAKANGITIDTPINVGDEDYDPLFAFGYGLSYTTFAYADLRTSTDRLPHDGSVDVEVSVTNTGERAGDEIVQPGEAMRPGLVYDSNGRILADAVQELVELLPETCVVRDVETGDQGDQLAVPRQPAERHQH